MRQSPVVTGIAAGKRKQDAAVDYYLTTISKNDFRCSHRESIYAPVAQLDRVTDSDSVGHWFESSRAYQNSPKAYAFGEFFALRSFICSLFKLRLQANFMDSE